MDDARAWLRAHIQPRLLRDLDGEPSVLEASRRVETFFRPWLSRELLAPDRARLELARDGMKLIAEEVDVEVLPRGPAAVGLRLRPADSRRRRDQGWLEIGPRGESVHLLHEGLRLRTSLDEGLRWQGDRWVVQPHKGAPTPGLVQAVRAVGVGMWWVAA